MVSTHLIYTPGNIMVDFNGSVLNLTSYTVMYSTKPIICTILYLLRPPLVHTGFLQLHSFRRLFGRFRKFRRKGLYRSSVPEASTSTSLTVLFVLGALAILAAAKPYTLTPSALYWAGFFILHGKPCPGGRG
jgi:hypothetical protein